MKLVKRMDVLVKLGRWLRQNDEQWKRIKREAFQSNKWFTEEFIDHRIDVITSNFLDRAKLLEWVEHYHIDDNIAQKKIGIVMAGNIPLVGFHDFLCSFATGHISYIRLSEKDSVLYKGIFEKMKEFDAGMDAYVNLSEMLKGCGAYIATGSNNTSRYFEFYFGRYPSIIRRNKTSVAVLSGNEDDDRLRLLADDVFLYFGLGCRSVTQLYVPEDYDFTALLNAFKKYDYLKDHVKFRNNYDYNLALLIMNNRKYMCNDCVILVEGNHLFSPVSELYYSYYSTGSGLEKELEDDLSVQCVVGDGFVAFGQGQDAGLFDYADGVDTIQFLLGL